MPRWKWFQRHSKAVDEVVDLQGAPLYGARHGAYARGAAPSEQPDWGAHTDIDRLPLITSGRRNQYGTRQRPAGLS